MHVAEPFIESMTAVFRSPYGADKDQQKAALKEYYGALNGYSQDVLDETWRRLRIRHTKVAWPVPAEIVKIASEVCGEEHVKEAKNIAIEEALETPQGQYALQRGAAKSFLASCKQLGWIPDQTLTERIVRQERYHAGTLNEYWLKVHQTRERELRQQYLKEAA